MRGLVILTILALAVASAHAGKCGGYKRGSTMCLKGANCGQANGAPCGPVDAETKKIILKTHNDLRMKIAKGEEKRGSPGPQPAGTNIQELVWNDELAQLAQRWAEQLLGAHDCSGNCNDRYYCQQSCRDTKDGKSNGQNMAAQGSTQRYPAAGADWPTRIKDWYEEVKMVNINDRPISYNNYMNIGHYTQLVWYSSKEIGCGMHGNNRLCASMRWPDYYCLNYVCNYFPAGNMISDTPYSTSARCNKYSKEYPKLCYTPPSSATGGGNKPKTDKGKGKGKC